MPAVLLANLRGPAGPAGKTAYQLAVDAGFNGTEADYLNSLRGQPGESIKGDPGPPGDPGPTFNILKYDPNAGKGDGTSDTAALNLLRADVAAADGGVALLPWTPFGYKFSNQAFLPRFLVRGERGVLVQKTGAASSFFWNVASGIVDVGFENVTLDSAGLSTSSTFRPATGSRKIRLRDVVMRDSGQSTAAYLLDMQTGTEDIRVERTRFENAPITVAVGDVTFPSGTDVAETTDPHNLVVGDVVQFKAITGTPGILPGAYYFVKSVPDPTHFVLANGAGAAAPSIGFPSAGTGVELALANGVVNAIRALGSVKDLRVDDCEGRGIRERFFYGSATTASGATTDAKVTKNDLRGFIPGGTSRQPITFQFQGAVDDPVFHLRPKVNENVVVGPGLSYNDTTKTGTADQISLHRCVEFQANYNTSTDGGDAGMTIAMQCEKGEAIGNHLHRNDTNGMYLGSAPTTWIRYILAALNECLDNGQARTVTRGNRYGIGAMKLSKSRVGPNVLGDTRANAQDRTQQHGLGITDCQDLNYGGNVYTNNAVSPVLITGTTNARNDSGDYSAAAAASPIQSKRKGTSTPSFSTTLTADPELSGIPVLVGGLYEVKAVLYVDAPIGADFRFQFAVPLGSSVDFTPNAFATTATAGSASAVINRSHATGAVSVGAVNAAQDTTVLPVGTILAGNDGTVGIEWGQATQDAVVPAILEAGSTLILTRIG